jgi:plastocyanin
MSRVLALVAGLLAAALGATGGAAAPAQATKLFGTVGPEFTITLRDAQGVRVTKLDPGSYAIEVEDLAEAHSFHLVGPGVDERTGVESTGTVTWNVTLQDAEYRYFCDPHPTQMRGSFIVGNPPVTTPPPTSPPVTSKTKLVLTSGPDLDITLKTSTGKAVKTMKRGTYTVVVRDRGRNHNAHVIAPGYDRKTRPLTYTGSQTWRVKLAKTGKLRFLCDPHALVGMKGSAKIVP